MPPCTGATLALANEALPPEWSIGMWEDFNTILADAAADAAAEAAEDDADHIIEVRGFKGYRELPKWRYKTPAVRFYR